VSSLQLLHPRGLFLTTYLLPLLTIDDIFIESTVSGALLKVQLNGSEMRLPNWVKDKEI